MRFDYDGARFSLEFPRRDVPVTLKHVTARLKPDQPAPTRRETTARLMRWDARQGPQTAAYEVMRATVRRYHHDPPTSNEEARVQALTRLLPFLPEAMRPTVLAAYYRRPRGKAERRKHGQIRLDQQAATLAARLMQDARLHRTGVDDAPV